MSEKDRLEAFEKLDVQRSFQSFKKNHLCNLNYITGSAKAICEELSNPSNSIYDGCRSFDDVCNVVETHSEGKLSGDSIVEIASKVCYKKDIAPDDSCYDDRIALNMNLRKMGITKENAVSVKKDAAVDDTTWKLFLLTHSNSLYRRWRKSLK